MSNVNVQSTSDTPEQVLAAVGGEKPAKETSVEKPAAGDKPAENTDASEPPEKQEKEIKADSKEETEEEEEEPGTKEPGKKKNGFKKRINKLNQRLADKEREADYWRQEAQKAKPAAQETKLDPTKETAAIAGKPVAGSFDTHEQFVEALADWKLDQRDQVKEAKAKETSAKTEFDTKVNNFRKSWEAYAKATPDAQEAIEAIDDHPMSNAVQALILESENGPELSYHLAKNADEWKRINSLSPMAAARELGKFEAKNVKTPAATETKETRTTTAPDPITPVKANKGATQAKSPEDMSYAEFKKWREQKRH